MRSITRPCTSRRSPCATWRAREILPACLSFERAVADGALAQEAARPCGRRGNPPADAGIRPERCAGVRGIHAGGSRGGCAESGRGNARAITTTMRYSRAWTPYASRPTRWNGWWARSTGRSRPTRISCFIPERDRGPEKSPWYTKPGSGEVWFRYSNDAARQPWGKGRGKAIFVCKKLSYTTGVYFRPWDRRYTPKFF